MTFVSNVLDFRGYDVIAMFHPMNILSLSYDRTAHNAGTALLLVQLLPLLVGWPAGLALAADRGLGTDTMLVARLGRKLYVTSKLTAVFIATAIVFSVPFLLEIVLNCLSFPLTATGNLIRIDASYSDYADIIGNYLCPWLYRFSPYLAAVLGRYFFAVLSGVLFFGQYAESYGWNSPLLYSLVYNGTYLGAEVLLTIVLFSIPAVRNLIDKAENLALN